MNKKPDDKKATRVHATLTPDALRIVDEAVKQFHYPTRSAAINAIVKAWGWTEGGT